MIKQILKEKIYLAVNLSYPKVEIVDFGVEETAEKFGDYSTNVAMILAKKAGEKPEKIAEKIIEVIRQSDDQVIESATLAGNGFINFKIQIPYLNEKIPEILEKGEAYGSSLLGQKLRVNIEFISANPTGPLTLGNGRNAYAGDCLANVYKFYGAKVDREYYFNDRGVQVTALGHSVLKDAEAVYKGAYIDEIAPRITTQTPIEAGMQAADILFKEYIKKTIATMGIEFDQFFSERSLIDKGTVFTILERLKELKLTYEKDGALWLKTSDYGDDKDRVLVKKDGDYTYFVSDIAYAYDKIRRGYNLCFIFLGADHHGFVGRLQAAVEILRKEEKWIGELKVPICQLVRLVSGGKEVRMSKRSGTYVLLDELLQEVGPDVTRFFFLDRSLDTQMDFDLDLAKEKSQKNPVFYVQYAYARIHSILEKSEIRNPKHETNSKKQNLNLLKEPEELALIKELMKLPELVLEIIKDSQVQKLSFYARSLAEKFHHFYEKCPVLLAENSETAAARIQLLKATQIVLKNTLDLMGITTPEKM